MFYEALLQKVLFELKSLEVEVIRHLKNIEIGDLMGLLEILNFIAP